MATRRQLIWLTTLQFMIVLGGFVAYLVIKHLYQSFVIVPSVMQALRDEIDKHFLGKARSETSSLWIILPWLALPLVIILGRNVASIFYRVGRMRRQLKRDTKAALLLKRLQEGHQEPFSLYLRSFSQEEHLKRRKGIWWYILIEGNIFGIDRETLDLMISSEVRYSYPMIALGRPGENLGAGRLSSTDADWEALVLLLMKQSKVIFIIPSTSTGVIWEMERLKDYYEKTIYIMPPTKYSHGAAESAERHWRDTQQEFTHRSIYLPNYKKRGALFMLDERGRVARSSAFWSPVGGSRVREFISSMDKAPNSSLKGVSRSVTSFVVSMIELSRPVIPIAASIAIALQLSLMVWQYSYAQNNSPVGNQRFIGQSPLHTSVKYDKDGLSFSHLSSWRITGDEIVEKNIRQISIENDANAIASILILPLEGSVDLEGFSAVIAKKRQTAMADLTISETEKLYIHRIIGGKVLQGIRQKFSIGLPGKTTPHTQDYFLIKTDKANALITIQAPNDEWESSEQGLQAIFDSLRY